MANNTTEGAGLAARFLNKQNFKRDLLSGFLVSLIALPLCLGVASASSFPPVTGVITSIIAGLVVAFISGSELAIKGPAAGLIVIVAGAVEEYGGGTQGYLLTTSLVVVTGLAQVLLGVLKVGRWADFIPSSVVHGMLAAIGIIVMSKQVHLLVGISPAEIKGMEPLELISHIPRSLVHLKWHIALVGGISLALLILLPRSRYPFIKAVPPFLVVIVVAAVVVQVFEALAPRYSFSSALIDPGKPEFKFFFDFAIFSGEHLGTTFKFFFLLTIIGTVESILTVKAVDILDPYKRTSDYNRDIIAVGIGNFLSGLLGALPMISEVARSSANINNKAITRVSAIMHGAFLVVFVLIFASLIKLIPVAALSSILIFVGYKLANPRSFLHAGRVSNEHLLVFVTTTFVTVAVDLLAGVVAGMVLKMLINALRSGELKKLFRARVLVKSTNGQAVVYLDTVAVFTNWLQVKKALEAESGNKLIVDFTSVKMVDSAFLDNLSRFRERYPHELSLKGFQELRPLKNHPHSMRLRLDSARVATVQLTRHQQKLKLFCEENNFIISFNSIIPPNYLAAFRGFRYSEIRQSPVYCTGSSNGIKFEYLECLVYDKVDMIEYQLNVVGVEMMGRKVPRFLMQKESKLEALVEFLTRNQVTIDDRPAFNSKYSIYAREAVTAVFTPAVLDFFEEYDMKDEIVEGDGNTKLIIYNSGSNRGITSLVRKLELLAGLVKGEAKINKVAHEHRT
jgi:MFS superfamily sulfate permease-like transporter